MSEDEEDGEEGGMGDVGQTYESRVGQGNEEQERVTGDGGLVEREMVDLGGRKMKIYVQDFSVFGSHSSHLTTEM